MTLKSKLRANVKKVLLTEYSITLTRYDLLSILDDQFKFNEHFDLEDIEIYLIEQRNDANIHDDLVRFTWSEQGEDKTRTS